MEITKVRKLTRAGTLGLAIVGAFVASTAAFAEEQVIAESETGKVTIDTESVQRNGTAVEAGYWAYSGAERVAVIARVEGCDEGQGRIKYKADPANPGTQVKGGQWTSAGGGITDRLAVAACEQADSDVKTRR